MQVKQQASRASVLTGRGAFMWVFFRETMHHVLETEVSVRDNNHKPGDRIARYCLMTDSHKSLPFLCRRPAEFERLSTIDDKDIS